MKILRILTKLSLAALVVLMAVALHASPVKAATNGRLIDDGVFDNTGTMSATDIQNFFNQFPSSCLSGYADAYPIDYFNYGGPTSAATIVRRAADFWGLNPRVILTKLQQEQSLVTGGAGCASWRYTGAMGFNCPDGSSCPVNPANAGYSRQVMRASWLLKISKERADGNFGWEDPADNSWVYGGPMTQGYRKRCGTCAVIYYDGWNNVGGTTLYIESGATASLYYYTPHVPSSFPTIWESWWGPGSTWMPAFGWGFAGQSSSVSLDNVPAGTTATWTVSAVNTGNLTWSNTGANPVRLGTSHPNDRNSAFCTAGWVSCSRAATLNEASVAPGQTGTFTFTAQVPNMPGAEINEYFNLLVEGNTWMNDPGLYFNVKIKPVIYSWSPTSQQAYTDSSKATPVDLTQLSPGQTAWLTLTATNTGNQTWSNSGSNPVRLGTWGPADRGSRFATGSWVSSTRPANLTQASVAPGGTGTFEFPITVPPGGGAFFEPFNLVTEGITWMNNTGLGYYTQVNSTYSWQVMSQYAYTDSSKTTPVNLQNLTAGQTVFIGFTAKNTGNSTWYQGGNFPLHAATWGPADRASAFASGWLANNRPVGLKEASVAPGQTGTFEFSYKAPAQTGHYFERFNLVAEAVAWLNDTGLGFDTTVH